MANTDFGFDIDMASLNAIVRRLSKDLFERPMYEAVQDTALVGERAARMKAKPHSVDTGITAGSIEHSLSYKGDSIHARVFTKKQYAHAVEFGRKPGGRLPPPEPIADWARRHGINIATFVLQRGIARRGTKGLFFMKAGRDAAKAALPGYVARAARQVAANWGKR